MLTLSCGKDKIKLKESMILQTDSLGNVIGGNTTGQWNVDSVKDSLKYSYLENQYNSYIDNFNCNYQPAIVITFGCLIPDTFQIIPFPNPVNDVKDLKLKIVSSVKFCLFHFDYVGITGKKSGGGGARGHFYENGECLCKNEHILEDVHLNLLFPTDDMKLTVTVVTEDGCLYTAEGYVMVN
jgi:hypothetical protein